MCEKRDGLEERVNRGEAAMGYTQLSLFDAQDQQSLKTREGLITFRMRANSRIKRGRLVVTPEEGLVVETPRAPSLGRARKMIIRRKNWVLDALESVREKQKRAQDIKRHPDSVLVFGKEKFVRVKTGEARRYVMETDRSIYFGFEQKRVGKTMLKHALAHWLKERAENYIPLRVRRLNQGRFTYRAIHVKNQQTLWGSCSSQGNLNFNWRLIMAPQEMSDYIIVHELCHTRYLNHSKPYWRLVESLCPDYEEAEKWFREYGFLLHVTV